MYFLCPARHTGIIAGGWPRAWPRAWPRLAVSITLVWGWRRGTGGPEGSSLVPSTLQGAHLLLIVRQHLAKVIWLMAS